MYPRSQGTWVEARDRPAGENQMKLDRMIGNISQVCRFGDLSDDLSAFQQTKNIADSFRVS